MTLLPSSSWTSGRAEKNVKQHMRVWSGIARIASFDAISRCRPPPPPLPCVLAKVGGTEDAGGFGGT
jgi:hypothetical protein